MNDGRWNKPPTVEGDQPSALKLTKSYNEIDECYLEALDLVDTMESADINDLAKIALFSRNLERQFASRAAWAERQIKAHFSAQPRRFEDGYFMTSEYVISLEDEKPVITKLNQERL